MNQILDRNTTKKNNGGQRRNPHDTPKIVKVYAFLLILFACCLIGVGGYTYYDNNNKQAGPAEDDKIPTIELVAQDDKVTIKVSAKKAVEQVTYRWYTGTRTVEDIHNYTDEVPQDTSEIEEISEDEDIEIDTEERMTALGQLISKKASGETYFEVPNIGIPRGTNTLHITVRLSGEEVLTEFVKTYTTDVGVDQIAPTIKVYVNTNPSNPRVVVIAQDETEIKNVIYSLKTTSGQDAKDVSITERKDIKTIKAEIPLIPNELNEVTITSVDKASNTAATYTKEIDLYKGKPEIVEFTAETDFSMVYAVARFEKGIAKTEYTINGGEPVVKEYPDLPKQVIIEIPTVEGNNHIVVKAYSERDDVYGEDYGDCEYNP